MTAGAEQLNYVAATLARQPIFDKSKQLRGYELLFRRSLDATTAEIVDANIATMKVIADAFVCLGAGLSDQPKIMVNFSPVSILNQIPYALPPEHTVVELGECGAIDEELVNALSRLKSHGYSLCLDGFVGGPGCGPVMSMVDYVKIDVLENGREFLADLVDTAKDSGALLLAKRVESGKLFDMAVSLGFSWFQGFFFQKPEIVPGRKLPSNQVTRLKIFQLLEEEDVDLEKLAEVIQADVSISYRLLTLLNSAAFALPDKIRSIHRAIIMLGMKQLKNWLRVIIFTDMAPKGKTRELSVCSVVRGKFLESAALAHQIDPNKAGALFLLGLFSLLEALLDLPMAEIAANLPLDDDLLAALCGEENEYADWLTLAKCFEYADWNTLDDIMGKYSLNPAGVAKSWFEALKWTNTFFTQNV